MAAARVLVVDDSSLARAVISESLMSHGLQVIGEAADGIHALEAYRRLRPDVVTMDLTMPGVDGLTALRSIVEFDPRARVVVVSVAGQEDVVVQALQAGAVGFLLKPFEPAQLVDILRRTGGGDAGGAPDAERRRLYVVEAQRRIEALGEDVRELAETAGVPDRSLLESIRRHAQVLAGMAGRIHDLPTGKLALALERLASSARGGRSMAQESLPQLAHDVVMALHKLLLSASRGEDAMVLADALRDRIDRALEAQRIAGAGDDVQRALVIDPDGFTRRILEGFLKREGFEVTAAEGLPDGIERAQQSRHALVIVDADTSRLDGLAAVKRLRSEAATAQTPILLLTPRGELGEKLAAFQAGADDVVVTPFEPEEVVARALSLAGRTRRGGNVAGVG